MIFAQGGRQRGESKKCDTFYKRAWEGGKFQRRYAPWFCSRIRRPTWYLPKSCTSRGPRRASSSSSFRGHGKIQKVSTVNLGRSATVPRTELLGLHILSDLDPVLLIHSTQVHARVSYEIYSSRIVCTSGRNVSNGMYIYHEEAMIYGSR